jgi:hypothetical protein
MKGFRTLLIGLALVGCFLMASCGDDNGNGGYHIVEYWPLGQGDTRIYGWNLSLGKTYDGLYTQTVSGIETIDGVEAVKLQDSDGFYRLMTNTNGLMRYKDGFETEYQRIFTPPLKEYPANVSVGKQHTFHSEVTVTDPDGTYAESVSITNTLEGIEEVTVPAGTFPECLKFTWTWTYVSSDGSSTICECTEWLAKDVGSVKYTEECQYTDPDGGEEESYTETTELVSATVGGVSYPDSSAKGVEDAKAKRSSLSVSPSFDRSRRR